MLLLAALDQDPDEVHRCPLFGGSKGGLLDRHLSPGLIGELERGLIGVGGWLQTIGVPIGGKIDFKVSSDAPVISPGEKKVLDVQFTNTGTTTVYSAQARLSAVDPFTSNDDTAFLGDLKPGDSALAHFEVSASKDATIKQYGLDSEIRYHDALDNSQILDAMKVPVNIAAQTAVSAILSNPIILALIAAVELVPGREGCGSDQLRYRPDGDA